jgi:hypothetical protein
MTKPKAKRKLSEIDFSKEDSHIALVSKEQGGPANGADFALVIKANNFSPEFVEKASKIRVTMDIQDFLSRFFSLYYEDAEVLARALGFNTERDEVEDYEEYIDNKVSSIEVIKSLKDEKEREVKLASLSEDQYLMILEDQSKLEFVLAEIDKAAKGETEATGNSTDITLVENNDVEPSGSDEDKLEKSMTVKTEMVEKAQFVALEKALEETKEALTKALADVEVYKAKEKEAVSKARFDKVLAAVKDEDKAKALFKALDLIAEAEAFDAAVKTLEDMTAAIEKSSLFEEKGGSADSDTPVVESAVAKAIKARQAKEKTKE